MIKAKKPLVKIVITFLVCILGFAACDFRETGSIKMANAIQKKVDGSGKFMTGPLMLNSAIPFYRESTKLANEWLGDVEAYGLTRENVENIQDWKHILDFLVGNLPDTQDAETNTVNAAYLGTLGANNTEVSGIFVYEFIEGLPFRKERITSANEFVAHTGEYYFLKNDYLIIASEQFLTNNGLAFDTLTRVIEQL